MTGKTGAWRASLLALGAGAGLCAGVLASGWSVRASFDWLTWATEDRGAVADTAVVVIALDRDLLKAHGVPGETRMTRAGMALLVRKLAELKPRAIGLDVEFPRAREPEGDAALRDALAAAGDVTIPEALVTLPGDGHEVTVRAPIAPLAESARHVGFVTLAADDDGTVRRVQLARTLHGSRRHHFALFAAARMLGAETVQVLSDRVVLTRRQPSLPHTVPVDASGSAWVRFTGDQPLPVIPGSALLAPGGPEARWRSLIADRFALVGGVEEMFADHHRVPAARVDTHRERLAGVLVLGQIIADVLESRLILEAPAVVGGLVAAALALIAAWLGSASRLPAALFGLALLLTVVLMGAIQAFLSGTLVDLVLLALVTLSVFCVARACRERASPAA